MALPLAIGLSETVQEQVGARLETVFVDEGFEFLDREALDLAKEALLIDLKDTGRLVGLGFDMFHSEVERSVVPRYGEVTASGRQGYSEGREAFPCIVKNLRAFYGLELTNHVMHEFFVLTICHKFWALTFKKVFRSFC